MPNLAGTYPLGTLTVNRIGFGAMQLAGPKVYGPPSDPAHAAQVLQAAVDAGINHIDTSDFYGPHTVNHLIRETLYPYRDGLVLVTKLGAKRTPDAGWHPAQSPAELRSGLEDNLRNLKLDCMDVVNLRIFTGHNPPQPGSIAERFETMLELQREGKIKHIGLSNIVQSQLEEALTLGEVVCVQNNYGVLNRTDDELLEFCADRGIAFVPFFPLNGFSPLQSNVLDEVAAEVGATKHQVALAWLLHGPENILLIPGTSKVAHLQQNIAAADIKLTPTQLTRLDNISTPPAAQH
jgi:aryl-alcohol dehydrogenase-like predicted oxidoreductase